MAPAQSAPLWYTLEMAPCGNPVLNVEGFPSRGKLTIAKRDQSWMCWCAHYDEELGGGNANLFKVSSGRGGRRELVPFQRQEAVWSLATCSCPVGLDHGLLICGKPAIIGANSLLNSVFFWEFWERILVIWPLREEGVATLFWAIGSTVAIALVVAQKSSQSNTSIC